jgi:small subunit ribosomal protein S9
MAEIKIKRKRSKRKPKPKVKTVQVKAKKKMAVARATIKKGKGRITLNKRSIDLVQPAYLLDLLQEPINLAGEVVVQGVNINIVTQGGGFMGQAVAARTAIAKALVEYTGDKKLKERFLNYDRLLLVDDSRRVEAKKPLGTKARKKKQSSKR